MVVGRHVHDSRIWGRLDQGLGQTRLGFRADCDQGLGQTDQGLGKNYQGFGKTCSGFGAQEGTQNMRYNVAVHESGFIPALPSAGTLHGPLFHPCGRGQLPLCDVKWQTLFRSAKGLRSEYLKLRA